MAQPYIGEIKMFAGNFAPAGWALCEGQLLPISENETLFNLIGTTYGGDGQSTFGLPDLRGRIPIHQGSGRVLAETLGVESVSLLASQIPPHVHNVYAMTSVGNSTGLASGGNQGSYTESTFAAGTTGRVYTDDNTPANLGNLNAGTIQNVGGSQPHDNLMPYLCINFIISLFGIFPSPS